MTKAKIYDVIIIGAGAAGLMCAIQAGQRGRETLLLDHSSKIGEKIRISGGGRCNFTNINTSPDHFISQNPHFCKSALKRYSQFDFIDLIKKHQIPYHEKTLGQLFCDDSSQRIIDMLVQECRKTDVKIEPQTKIESVNYTSDQRYEIKTHQDIILGKSLVIASGGLSIPKIGATRFGYDIARQFGLNIIETQPALVPLTFQSELLERCKSLSGVSTNAIVSYGKTEFQEGMLFTHRGLSGPSILQISSYWEEGQQIAINLAPGTSIQDYVLDRKATNPKQEVVNLISELLPKRLAISICGETKISGRLADLSKQQIRELDNSINNWTVKPSGSEGYRTAEVTLGGVDTAELSSKTMEAKKQPGLYFIGEVVDVTGHLGGYNFQWAWSSAYAAGQFV